LAAEVAGAREDRAAPVMQRVPDAMYEFGVIGKPYNITGMIQPENGEVR
jgi:hypothetical protein